MKGTEERDILFGKLFNYLAMIRAGRVSQDEPTTLYLLDRLVELHKRKGWIREVVSETILLLFETTLPCTESFLLSARHKLKLILESDDLEESPAHDLVLFSGLQTFVSSLSPEQSHLLDDVVPKEPIFSAENFSSIENTLLSACHGFPKVWTKMVPSQSSHFRPAILFRSIVSGLH
jgi:hypothetical protein